MVKNKLESTFSKSIKANKYLYGMKLHNNPLAHQNTPADYLLTNGSKVHLVECKQVTCKNGKGRLVHKRLKQMHDLISFAHRFEGFHNSWFCIGFFDNGWSNSEIYLIPVLKIWNAVNSFGKVSFNRDDMFRLFSDYKIKYESQTFDLQKLQRG